MIQFEYYSSTGRLNQAVLLAVLVLEIIFCVNPLHGPLENLPHFFFFVFEVDLFFSSDPIDGRKQFNGNQTACPPMFLHLLDASKRIEACVWLP